MAPEILRGPGRDAVAPDVDVFRLPRRGAAGGLRLPAHRLLHRDGRVGAARRRRPGARGDATPARGPARWRSTDAAPSRRLLAQLSCEVSGEDRKSTRLNS